MSESLAFRENISIKDPLCIRNCINYSYYMFDGLMINTTGDKLLLSGLSGFALYKYENNIWTCAFINKRQPDINNISMNRNFFYTTDLNVTTFMQMSYRRLPFNGGITPLTMMNYIYCNNELRTQDTDFRNLILTSKTILGYSLDNEYCISINTINLSNITIGNIFIYRINTTNNTAFINSLTDEVAQITWSDYIKSDFLGRFIGISVRKESDNNIIVRLIGLNIINDNTSFVIKIIKINTNTKRITPLNSNSNTTIIEYYPYIT